MDFGAILSAIVTLTLAGIGGLAWLFKVQGSVGILRERLTGEIELRKALEARLNGFEQRIYQTLERIEDKLDGKANRDE